MQGSARSKMQDNFVPSKMVLEGLDLNPIAREEKVVGILMGFCLFPRNFSLRRVSDFPRANSNVRNVARLVSFLANNVDLAMLKCHLSQVPEWNHK